MTGVVEPPDDEAVIFRRVMDDYVLPATGGAPDPGDRAALAAVLARVAEEPHLPARVEPRMVPSVKPKERHHPFIGN
jgi:hypothetical protein